MENLNSLPEQDLKQLGVTLSFVVVFPEGNSSERLRADIYLADFIKSVAELAKTGFPRLKHTVASRQEYMP